MTFNVAIGMYLSDKYLFRTVGCHGPSMMPTFDTRNNLLLVDVFTTQFVRIPRKGEIIITENPFKPGTTLVKRVINTEGEMAEFYCSRTKMNQKVEIPQGHIWIEGDNKKASRDSRDFGPLSLCLVDGIVRARIWPFDKIMRC